MSKLYVSKLECLLVQELNKQINQSPPIIFHKELYETACKHAKDVILKKVKNVKDGSKERKLLFPNSKRYSEMNFVSTPFSNEISEDEKSKYLSSLITGHYKTTMLSGINSIGPALFPLKSQKILIIILVAYFKPYIPATLFKESFEYLSKQKIPPNDKSNFVKLLNEFRALAKFDQLATVEPKTNFKFCAAKYHYKCSVQYSIQLFQLLVSNYHLYDILVDYWTKFSIEIQNQDESHFTLILFFYRHSSFTQYEVDVEITQSPDKVDQIKPEFLQESKTSPEPKSSKPELELITNLSENPVVERGVDLQNEKFDSVTENAADLEKAIQAEEAIKDSLSNQKSEIQQASSQARQAQELLENQASVEAEKAQQAESLLHDAKKSAREAAEKANEAGNEAAAFDKLADVQSDLFHQSEQVKESAEKKQDDADSELDDLLAQIGGDDVIERNVNIIEEKANEASEFAQNEENVIQKADGIANEALQQEKKLRDEAEEQRLIEEKQRIIQAEEEAKIPELETAAQEALEMAASLEEGTQKQAEIASKLDELQKKVDLEIDSADQVLNTLQENLEVEADAKLDLDISEIKKKIRDQQELLGKQEIEIAQSTFAGKEKIEEDKLREKEKNPALDQNYLIEDNFINDFDYDAETQEKAKKMLQELLAKNQESKNNDNENNNFQQSFEDNEEAEFDEGFINSLEDDVNLEPADITENLVEFESRGKEVEPAFDNEYEGESNLISGVDYPPEVEVEAAKILKELFEKK